jgi:hypothetical protein
MATALHARDGWPDNEADDRINGWAFSPSNPFGAKLNAIYS